MITLVGDEPVNDFTEGVGEHTIVNLSIFMVYLVFDCYSVLYMDILILVDDISCPKT